MPAIFKFLDKYSKKGSFQFRTTDQLSKVCNAPDDSVGVYLVCEDRSIIYIGRSGIVLQNGMLKIRKGGLYSRIVDGKQFGEQRKRSWLEKMKTEGIDAIDIKWYCTFDKKNHDIPTYVEAILLQEYFEEHISLPRWNTSF